MYQYNSKNRLKSAICSGLFLGVLALTSASYAAMPVSQIVFSNETAIALNTSIAGIPGNGIEANTSKPVGFEKVTMGCFWGGNMQNCGINFTDKANGQAVATVYINANTATLTQAPVFHGDYASKYEVTGWETSPVTHITIKEKA